MTFSQFMKIYHRISDRIQTPEEGDVVDVLDELMAECHDHLIDILEAQDHDLS